jgi:hypothetical protein
MLANYARIVKEEIGHKAAQEDGVSLRPSSEKTCTAHWIEDEVSWSVACNTVVASFVMRNGRIFAGFRQNGSPFSGPGGQKERNCVEFQ